MKQIIKYLNYFWFGLALCAMAISGCGCSAPNPTPDPLAGWQMDFAPKLDPTIEKDCRDYVQTLSPEEQKVAHVSGYFKDEVGQHAVKIETPLNGTWWVHVLIYDKDNKRIKTIKYSAGHYSS